MTVKLLTEHHLEFLSLKGGCTGSPESTLVKMPHCWKTHFAAQLWETQWFEIGSHKCRAYFLHVTYNNNIDYMYLEE